MSSFDLFTGELDKLKKHLELQKSKVALYEQKLIDGVSQDMYKNIEINAGIVGGMASLSDTQEIAELSNTIDKIATSNLIEDLTPKHKRIHNTTQEATYAEFGTGMMGAESPHALNSMGWEYDVNAHGERGWRYIGQGGLLVHTKGYPAFSVYYHSYSDGIDNLPQVAKLTFREVFGDDEE